MMAPPRSTVPLVPPPTDSRERTHERTHASWGFQSRPSDRNHKPAVYSIEVMTNGNFPGAPPVYELLEEPAEGIDTKASVIEALATAKYEAELVA